MFFTKPWKPVHRLLYIFVKQSLIFSVKCNKFHQIKTGTIIIRFSIFLSNSIAPTTSTLMGFSESWGSTFIARSMTTVIDLSSNRAFADSQTYNSSGLSKNRCCPETCKTQGYELILQKIFQMHIHCTQFISHFMF